MEVRQVIINKVDLKKLMADKGINSFYQLAKISGVKESYINRCVNGKMAMSQNSWDKIKQWL